MGRVAPGDAASTATRRMKFRAGMTEQEAFEWRPKIACTINTFPAGRHFSGVCRPTRSQLKATKVAFDFFFTFLIKKGMRRSGEII